MSRKIRGLKPGNRDETTDNYHWFWGLCFETNRGEVKILLPREQDLSMRDEVMLDRSIAVYTAGQVSDWEIKTLLEKIHTVFIEIENCIG